ncbi:hypothetical protein NUM3379_32950 [Kineococcus sp. NUM-3379]
MSERTDVDDPAADEDAAMGNPHLESLSSGAALGLGAGGLLSLVAALLVGQGEGGAVGVLLLALGSTLLLTGAAAWIAYRVCGAVLWHRENRPADRSG